MYWFNENMKYSVHIQSTKLSMLTHLPVRAIRENFNQYSIPSIQCMKCSQSFFLIGYMMPQIQTIIIYLDIGKENDLIWKIPFYLLWASVYYLGLPIPISNFGILKSSLNTDFEIQKWSILKFFWDKSLPKWADTRQFSNKNQNWVSKYWNAKWNLSN